MDAWKRQEDSVRQEGACLMVRVIACGKSDDRVTTDARIFDDGYPSELCRDGLVIRQEKTHAVLYIFEVDVIVRVDYTPRPHT